MRTSKPTHPFASRELVAWSSLHLAEAVRSCLHACGQDPDIVQVLVGCEAEAAQALTADERIDSLLFIGSEETGKRVAEKAGAAGTQVTLELGGKVHISAEAPFTHKSDLWVSRTPPCCFLQSTSSNSRTPSSELPFNLQVRTVSGLNAL